MSHDDEQCLKLGRMVVRMIRDLEVARGDTAYGRRTVTYPGGEVALFVVNDLRLADLFERAAAGEYEVKSIVPPSQVV